MTRAMPQAQLKLRECDIDIYCANPNCYTDKNQKTAKAVSN